MADNERLTTSMVSILLESLFGPIEKPTPAQDMETMTVHAKEISEIEDIPLQQRWARDQS